MKITVALTEYTAIKNLSFAPEIDVTGSEIPINEFEVDIVTTDNISVGQYAYLYDDATQPNLWAKYWIIYAEHKDEKTVRLKAQSQLKLLERRMLDPVMYTATSVSSILALIFAELGSGEYSLDSSLSSATVTGFCPRQSAKTRLQWICFVINAYVKSFFSDKIEILPIDDNTETFIPIDRTFWKPSVEYTNYVTRVRARAYSFTQGTPSATDTWVSCQENGATVYYIVTSTTVSLANPDVPSGTLTHEVTVDDIMLINNDNISAILSYLAKYYFRRMELDVDVINNADYVPGDKIVAHQDENTLVTGYIEKTEFSFGLQARARMNVAAVEVKPSAVISIIYHYGDYTLGSHSYLLPIGYSYEIDNPWFDMMLNYHRKVFRPRLDKNYGVVVESGDVIDIYYDVTLDYVSNFLHIISVDGVALDEHDNTKVVIE